LRNRLLLLVFLLPSAVADLLNTQSLPDQKEPAVHFTEVTDFAGIAFRHISAPEKKYIVESIGGGVALFDYDNDGCMDIYFTNALTVDPATNPDASRSSLDRNN